MPIPKSVDSKSRKLKETNDCAVKAIAIATSTDYDEVHQLCQRFGRKPRKGTTLHTMRMALHYLGWHVNTKMKWKGRTTTTLKLPFAGRYIALTTNNRHALAVRGGLVKDYTDDRRHRIEAVWEITKREAI